jgi:hypothetical protein
MLIRSDIYIAHTIKGSISRDKLAVRRRMVEEVKKSADKPENSFSRDTILRINLTEDHSDLLCDQYKVPEYPFQYMSRHDAFSIGNNFSEEMYMVQIHDLEVEIIIFYGLKAVGTYLANRFDIDRRATNVIYKMKNGGIFPTIVETNILQDVYDIFIIKIAGHDYWVEVT